jgi:hypothetical protein
MEAEYVLDSYLENPRHLVPVTLKSAILPLLSRRRAAASASKDFPGAARLSRVENDLRRYFHRYRDRDLSPPTLPADGPSSSIALRLTEAKASADADLAAYMRGRDEAISELRRKHEIETERFKQHWTTENAFLNFSKASPFLLQLRDVERRRLLLTEYEAAEEARRFADDVQFVETCAAREKAAAQWRAELSKLRDRHRAEIEAAEAFTQTGLSHLAKRREAAVVPLENALRKAEIRERHELNRMQSRNRQRAKVTPRATPKRGADLRAAPAVTKLDFGGFDVQAYVNQQKAKTRAVRSRLAIPDHGKLIEEKHEVC